MVSTHMELHFPPPRGSIELVSSEVSNFIRVQTMSTGRIVPQVCKWCFFIIHSHAAQVTGAKECWKRGPGDSRLWIWAPFSVTSYGPGPLLCRRIHRLGDVAQMVERPLSMREALGSTPSFSTLSFFPQFSNPLGPERHFSCFFAKLQLQILLFLLKCPFTSERSHSFHSSR